MSLAAAIGFWPSSQLQPRLLLGWHLCVVTFPSLPFEFGSL